LRTALSNNEIELAQTIVGTEPDGDFGPATERAIAEFRATKQQQQQDLLDQIDSIRTETNPIINRAREEIQILRLIAENEINNANDLIARLRSQIGTTDSEQIQQQVQREQQRIFEAETQINELTSQKYELEAAYRILEAEVGPIKYIAEFIYGDTDQDLLEEAVRWVIILIIFVFDPLAVLLLIASQYTFRMYSEDRKEKDSKTSTIVKENNNELVRSNTVGGIQSQDASDRSNISSGNTTDQGRNQEDNTTIAQRDGSRLEGRVSSERMVVPAQTVDPVEILDQYQDKVLTAEELREAEYQQKELDDEFHNDKEQWKADHPDQTLKKYKALFIKGKIDKLPWEGYVQNSEQNESSLWNKIKSNDND
jgi:hypothetical protein